MTETTVAVAEEQPAAEPAQRMTLEELLEKMPWPLAEAALTACPGALLALTGSNDDDLTELIALGKGSLPVFVSDKDREAWRAEDEALAAEVDGYRAEVVTDSGAALMRATENLWPVSAHYQPLQLVPGEEARQQHQQASVTDLRRWAPGKSFSDEPDDTRFLDAFALDPEGDEDRAPLPDDTEIHHEHEEQC